VQLHFGPGGEPEEVYADFTVTGRRNDDGMVVELAIDVVDVTERVRKRQTARGLLSNGAKVAENASTNYFPLK
jgi:hypothetical protein